MYKNIHVKFPSTRNNRIYQTGFELLKQQVEMRCASQVSQIPDGLPDELEIQFDISGAIGTEGFSVTRQSDRCIHITGNDEPGLLYGIGKFLRSSRYGQEGFQPSEWQGASIPDRQVRGMYLATHFHNFYHDAPLEKVRQYIGDLVLWGVNTLCVWFDMHHYKSMEDLDAVAMISRIRDIFSHARSLYMKTCLMVIGNESFAESPTEMRASYTAGHDGYKRQLAGHYHVELCPGKAGALETLLQWRKEVFGSFLDIPLDYVCIWPYDQGGCTCSDCRPWGANGYLKAARPVAELARQMFPGVKIILSTWLFDSFTSREWSGLRKAFKVKPEWADYLLAEFLDGKPSGVVAKHGFPGGLPCVGFPEISMYGATPWGGFGANPLPCHIQKVWDKTSQLFSGGFPYSEGIFDDMNKFIYTRLYWGDAGCVRDIVGEYIDYAFGGLYRDEITSAVLLLEKAIIRNRLDEDGRNHNYPDDKIPWKGKQRFVIDHAEGIDEAHAILSELDMKLPETVRNSWRWRILCLRGRIDAELLHNGFETNNSLEEAYGQLTDIYHAANADYWVAPPTLESIKANRGGFSWF